jgi:parallel beta-helix repeat protein
VRRAARLPDTGWFPIRKPEGDSAFDAQDLPGGDWRGAWIHLKSTAWNLDGRRIASQSGKRISLSTPAFKPLTEGWGWFVSGVPQALSGDDQWAQDSASGKVWWRPALGENPGGVRAELGIRPCGVYLRGGRHDIQIRGIGFSGQTENGICGEGSSRIEVREVLVRGVDQWGARLWGRENSIRDSRVQGATTGGFGILGPKGVMERDTVMDIGRHASLGPQGHGRECCGGRGLQLNGDSGILRRSVVRWTAWSGVHFSGKDQLLEENVVDSAVQEQNDGGGLYTYSKNYADSNGVRTRLWRNIVRDTRGNTQGASHYRQGQGIYLDLAVSGMSIRENTVSGCQDGVLMHDNRGDTVVGNLFHGNQLALQVYRDTTIHELMEGNRFDSNLVVSYEGQAATRIDIVTPNPLPSVGISGNMECRIDPVETICTQEGRTDLRVGRAGVSEQPGDLFPVANGYGVRGWQGYPATVKLSKRPEDVTESVAFDVRHQDTVAKPTGLVLHVAGTRVTKGELDALTFSARGFVPGMRVRVQPLMSHTPYHRLAESRDFDLDTVWKSYRMVFRITESDTNARVDFQLRGVDSALSLRAIRWSRLDTSSVQPGPRALLTVSDQPASVAPRVGTGSWVDAWGRASSETVGPFQSAVRFRDDAGTSIGPRTIARPHLRLWIERGQLHLSSESGRAGVVRCRVMDARGRTILDERARVDSGKWNARWEWPRGVHLGWIRVETPDGNRETRAIWGR